MAQPFSSAVLAFDIDGHDQPRAVDGINVVLFAGGGGSDEGIEQALRELGDPHPIIDVAMNHDEEACAMYRANHPATRVYCQNVWRVKPAQVIADHHGRPINILWASPDCKHFSKAKGGTPVEKNIRDLAWVVHEYTRLPRHLRPLEIYLENVEEFRDWGPLRIRTIDGVPVTDLQGNPVLEPHPDKKGETFNQWKAEFRRRGYTVRFKELRASRYGAPTIRKRLYMVAKLMAAAAAHGQQQRAERCIFPRASHGPERGLRPMRVAAECIDFSRHCPSIFGRKKDLAPATLRRVARGCDRYVLRHADPFLIHITHHWDHPGHSIREPMRTITGAHRGETALIAPHITKFRTGATGSAMTDPLPTVTANSFIKRPGGAAPLGEVEAKLAPFITRTDMQSAADRNGIHSPTDQVRTITSAGGFAVAAPLLAGCGGRAAQSPPKSVEVPFNTPTAKADQILVAPIIAGVAHGEFKDRPGLRSHRPDEPVRNINAGGGDHASVQAVFVAKHFGGHETPGWPVDKPLSTATAQDHHSVVSSSLINLKGADRRDASIEAPTPTACAQGLHLGEVRAVFAVKYYGTATGQTLDEGLHSATAKARMAVVEVDAVPTPDISDDDRYGAWWVTQFLEREGVLPANDDGLQHLAGDRPGMVLVKGMPMVDIGMRMLEARELFNAQGFPPGYIIDRGLFVIDGPTGQVLEWRPLTKTSQIRMCGNSVCPPVARALVLANHVVNDNRTPLAAAAGD